jgi:ADP-ribosyl-[dinitrogen reductase] hydrolase
MKVLDSLNSPLRIDALQVAEDKGWIGMTICPGKKRPDSIAGHWDRNLNTDVDAIAAWGASVVVTLLEDHEFAEVGVMELPDRVRGAGMHSIILSIPDRHAPTASFELAWHEQGPLLHQRLECGERILIHCMGGIGRTGTVAARLLIERGMAVEEAIAEVRRVRHGAIETAVQETYLRVLGTSMPRQ